MTYQFRAHTQLSYETAKRIAPIVIGLIGCPGSVVDLGGGVGSWCKAFKENGVMKVTCIDHSTVESCDLLVREDEFLAYDVECEMPPIVAADLAVSIEFAEHVRWDRSEAIVQFLTSSAPIVLFAAAIPGQGGLGHINEQRPSFWRALFQERGFKLVDVVRPRILFDKDILPWIRQNLYLYVHTSVLHRIAVPSESYLFLPDDFELVELRILSRTWRVSELLTEVPRALSRALSRRVRRRP